LIPQLKSQGYEVTASTRSRTKAEQLRALGAEPVVVDALDRDAVMQAVMRAEPDVVIHQLTAIGPGADLKHFDRWFERTNRLRTEGTDHLLEAARAAGTRRFIAQSYCAWSYERTGSEPKTEDSPLDPNPPAEQTQSLAAIRHLESAVLGATALDGIVLRYGAFYGPGTGISVDGDQAELVRKRRFPVVGDGTGMWSFIHIDDAASATVAAIDHGEPGIYNIVDDEPVPVAKWLPELARNLGAKPPRRVPEWIGRLATGEVGVSMTTQIRGASNAKAKRELGWAPRFRTYREGFARGLADEPAPAASGSEVNA
jgi:nucleoside-diphosphate-sugar epimerase